MNQISICNHKKLFYPIYKHKCHSTVRAPVSSQGVEAKTDVDITSIEKQKEKELKLTNNKSQPVEAPLKYLIILAGERISEVRIKTKQ